jgi:hypothetical protein
VRGHLLVESLQAAVPLWAAHLHSIHPDDRAEMIQRWAADAVDPLAGQSDIGQYGGGKKGEVAAWFNHVARGVTALSFSPGGVTVFGEHWCQNHAECSETYIEFRKQVLADSLPGAASRQRFERPARPIEDVPLTLFDFGEAS